MKTLGILLFCLAALGLVDAIREEISGTVRILAPGRYTRVREVKKVENPRDYRNLMTYQWVRFGTFVGAGLFCFHIIKRSEETDPFSPNFKGKEALDDLSTYLDQEKEKR
jgi:hypothetical protein